MRDDISDFLISQSEELLNNHQCPYCNVWFHIDEAVKISGKKNAFKCPDCASEILIDN